MIARKYVVVKMSEMAKKACVKKEEMAKKANLSWKLDDKAIVWKVVNVEMAKRPVWRQKCPNKTAV